MGIGEYDARQISQGIVQLRAARVLISSIPSVDMPPGVPDEVLAQAPADLDGDGLHASVKVLDRFEAWWLKIVGRRSPRRRSATVRVSEDAYMVATGVAQARVAEGILRHLTLHPDAPPEVVAARQLALSACATLVEHFEDRLGVRE
jgi:hypothetical protein